MTASTVLLQFLNGLAGASALFLVAAGLSLIFGVTRVVNFAHGSLFMLGMYVAVALAPRLGFWASVPVAALAVAVMGVAIEVLLLRRLYAAPELLQLLATFALVLVMRDAALWLWGPADLLGPRAPGLDGAIAVTGGRVPTYDFFLILVGPAVLAALWLLLNRTRWGRLVRAAAQDRDMAAALGIDARVLYTSVFVAGAFLAGLGGALQIPREPASLALDLPTVADAFVIVVVGGLGSIPGAFLAALLISELKSFCVAFDLAGLELAVEFIVMAAVLIVRPWGLMGRPPAITAASPGALAPQMPPPGFGLRAALCAVAVALAIIPVFTTGYPLVLLTDILAFALFAVSLHVLIGPGGLLSFGHAAYFGIGAYAAGMLMLKVGAPMGFALLGGPLAAAAAAALFGGFCVRLSGVYLAMLTLAFAQIAWSIVYQADAITGGSNGLIGVWPAELLSGRVAYYYFSLAIVAAAIAGTWIVLFSPAGYALRATRDSPRRAEAIGIRVRAHQWVAFVFAGLLAGLAGALYV
ncbi:MAG: ABC transporter permease, partial [Burkholderiales bacterium]